MRIGSSDDKKPSTNVQQLAQQLRLLDLEHEEKQLRAKKEHLKKTAVLLDSKGRPIPIPDGTLNSPRTYVGIQGNAITEALVIGVTDKLFLRLANPFNVKQTLRRKPANCILLKHLSVDRNQGIRGQEDDATPEALSRSSTRRAVENRRSRRSTHRTTTRGTISIGGLQRCSYHSRRQTRGHTRQSCGSELNILSPVHSGDQTRANRSPRSDQRH